MSVFWCPDVPGFLVAVLFAVAVLPIQMLIIVYCLSSNFYIYGSSRDPKRRNWRVGNPTPASIIPTRDHLGEEQNHLAFSYASEQFYLKTSALRLAGFIPTQLNFVLGATLLVFHPIWPLHSENCIEWNDPVKSINFFKNVDVKSS